MLCEDESAQQPFARDTEAFYNSKIRKVEVTIEGGPQPAIQSRNACLPDVGRGKEVLCSRQQTTVAEVAKDLALADVSIGVFLTNKFTLWLDLRTTDDDRLHGSGRRIENASAGVTIQITKQAKTAGALNIYLYVIMNAQLNIGNGRFVSAIL